jgi:hypothetical protein
MLCLLYIALRVDAFTVKGEECLYDKVLLACHIEKSSQTTGNGIVTDPCWHTPYRILSRSVTKLPRTLEIMLCFYDSNIQERLYHNYHVDYCLYSTATEEAKDSHVTALHSLKVTQLPGFYFKIKAFHTP